MAMEYQNQHNIGTEDPYGLLARAVQRNPLHELRDYPFFAPEGDGPTPTRAIPHAGAWLATIALIIVLEAIVLGLLLR